MILQSRRAEIALVYAVAFFQGIGNIVFPASATIFKTHHGFSDSNYGLLYLAMIFFAISSSLTAAFLVHRLPLKTIFLIGTFGYTLSQLLLALSYPAQSYALVLLSISILGIGFGFTGTAVNFYPTQFFPTHRDAAIIFVHVAFGIGATLAPTLLAFAQTFFGWASYPAAASLLLFALAIVSFTLPLQANIPHASSNNATPSVPFGLWLFCIVAVLYALCEATFSNWSVIFLVETKGLSLSSASSGLSAFWFALTFGRLLASILARSLGAEKIYLVLPPMMALAFLLTPIVNSESNLLLCFLLAGFGCSAFFPLNVSLAIKYFPEQAAMTGGLMSAFVMLGIGIVSYGIAPLRQHLALEKIYLFSSIYPILAMLLGFALVKKFSRLHAVQSTS